MLANAFLVASLALQMAVHSEATDLRVDVSGVKEKPFQSIWFRDGKAIGLERHGPVPLPPRADVDVEVTTSAVPSYAETKAIAAGILRTALNLLLNDDKLKSVKLPDTAFSGTLLELQFRNMKTAEISPPPNRRLFFTIESKSGLKRILYY